MKTAQRLGALVLFFSLALAGCKDSADKRQGAEGKEYGIKGKVVSVSPDKKEVTLDHEAIPELNMMAMKMVYPTEDAKVLDGIQPGDQVEGRLKVIAGKNTVVKLKKL